MTIAEPANPPLIPAKAEIQPRPPGFAGSTPLMEHSSKLAIWIPAFAGTSGFSEGV